MEFFIGGKKIELTREKVEEVLERLEPEPIKKYYIEYKGEKYPIKQVISAATGLPRVSITPRQAYRILIKLGFEVKELRSGS